VSPTAGAFLEARGLRVDRGGVEVLEIPALTLSRGSCLALVGPNGAGKSTFLLALAALLRPAAGTLLLEGQPVVTGADLRAYRRRVGMVFQQPLLFDTTVAGNIAAGLRLRGTPREDARRRVEECARRFGISSLLHRSARTLSGGEAQRTSLARAFVLAPEVLFLDEPFASLDPPTRSGLVADLRRVLRETGTTAVLSTHDPAEAVRLSDLMAVMAGGRIAQLGPSHDVMLRPASAFVAAFLGVETILSGRVTGGDRGLLTVEVAGLPVLVVGDAAAGEDVLLCLRPEQVAIGLRSVEATSVRNAFPGRVVAVLPDGASMRVEVDCGFPLVAAVSRPALEELDLVPGREVISSFKATAVHLMRR
jgi:tungstate transport system ATP-binding protein